MVNPTNNFSHIYLTNPGHILLCIESVQISWLLITGFIQANLSKIQGLFKDF